MPFLHLEASATNQAAFSVSSQSVAFVVSSQSIISVVSSQSVISVVSSQSVAFVMSSHSAACCPQDKAVSAGHNKHLAHGQAHNHAAPVPYQRKFAMCDLGSRLYNLSAVS